MSVSARCRVHGYRGIIQIPGSAAHAYASPPSQRGGDTASLTIRVLIDEMVPILADSVPSFHSNILLELKGSAKGFCSCWF